MKLKHLLACMAFITTGLMASVSYAEGIVTGISAPASAAQGTPVSVTLTGNGFCDSYTITWGDTHSNTISGPANLPHSPPAHTYTSTGTRTISVASHPGCIGGTVSTSINITGVVVPDSPTISSITGSSCAKKGSSYKIKVNGSGGSGICNTLNVNWGDTHSSNYANHNLTASPWRSHTYNSLGTKTITASGANGCSGTKTKTITVKNSCIYVLNPNLFRKMVFKIWVKLPWPWPPCLSCPPWIKDIRWREAQMNKYSKLAQKPGKRQAYYMRQFKMHKAARTRTIGKYNRAKNRAMKLKGGKRMVPAGRMQKAPMKRMQMR